MDESTRKILIVSANPKDTGRLRLDKEVRDIKGGLARQSKRENFQIECLSATRQEDIRRGMLDFNPNIVHFCGHGSENKGLAFEDDSEFSRFASAQSLASFFKLFRDSVDCIVLNACYSKEQASAISEHIRYVVGMNETIKDDIAIEFSVAFYDSIFAGKSYKFAFDMAQNSLQWGDDDKGNIPVLLTCATSGLDDNATSNKQIPAWQNRITSAFKGRHRIGIIKGYAIKNDVMININRVINENFLVIQINPPSVFEYTKNIEENIEIIDCILYIASHNSTLAWNDYIKKIAQEHNIPFLCICEDALS